MTGVEKYLNDPLLEVSEPIFQEMGTCDGCTTTFMGHIRAPVVPGSVIVRVTSDSAVDQLALVDDPTACWASGHDITKDGVLHGKINHGTVDYLTGQVHVDLPSAPNYDYRIEVIWQRFVHKYRHHTVEMSGPDGEKVTVSVPELQAILGLA
jgi:hypothetical protein